MGAAVIASQVIQLVYSIVSSRILTPQAFGAYASSLAALSLITILAVGGLDLAVSRSSTSPDEIPSLVGVAIFVGIFWALLVQILAGWWSVLWGDPGSEALLRLLGVAVLLLPLNAVVFGLARQAGRFRRVSIAQAAAAVVGTVTAVVALVVTGSPYALPLPVVLSAVLTTALGPWTTGRTLRPGRPRRSSVAYLTLGGRATVSNLIEYSGWSLVQLATTRGAGPSALGQLNRALAFASMPILATATSLSNVLAPTYGQAEQGERAAGLHKASVVSLWAGIVMGGLVASVLYPTMPVLLGADWAESATLAVFMAVGAGGTVAATPTSIFLQSRDRFAEFRRVQYVTTAIYVAAAAAVLSTHDVLWSAVAYAAVTWTRLFLLWWHLRRRGEVRGGLAREGLLACLTAVLLALLLLSVFASLVGRFDALWAGALIVVALVGSLFLTKRYSEAPGLIRGLVRRT